jgi:hypothetical protein
MLLFETNVAGRLADYREMANKRCYGRVELVPLPPP